MAESLPTLILCAHGRGVAADRRHVPELLAEELRADGLFADVRTAYLKGRPDLATALAQPASAEIVLVPLLMADGYTNKVILPAALETVGAGQVTVARPVGESPALVPMIHGDAKSRCEALGWASRDTTIFIAGHGTGRDRNSAATAERLAAEIARSADFRDVRAAFLEQEPFLEGALRSCRPNRCLVIGFFMDQGGHGAEDIPRLIAREHPEAAYTGPIGALPEFATVVHAAALAAI
ncbi:MAG: CbiX/SirB N-terminal domain-containing protein [Pseudomonadota bacterium]